MSPLLFVSTISDKYLLFGVSNSEKDLTISDLYSMLSYLTFLSTHLKQHALDNVFCSIDQQ